MEKSINLLLNEICKTSDSNSIAPLKSEEKQFSQESVGAFLDFLRETLEYASEKIFALEETLEILTKKHLNKKQLELLLKTEQNEGLLYYQLINNLSQEGGLPESTVRWNINRLRDAKMIVTGDKNNNGIPVKLTKNGKIVASVFKNGKKK